MSQDEFDLSALQARYERTKGRRRAAVDHAQVRATQGAPACHRQARFTQADHQHTFSGQGAHLSFRVDRPNSTSMMVMIQNRTTTWVSFQPPSSK